MVKKENQNLGAIFFSSENLGGMDLATRISLITPRSFDSSKPRELQAQLAKRWGEIRKDFAIEKVNNQIQPAQSEKDNNQTQAAQAASENEDSGKKLGSRQFVKIVCMSDTHSTQGEFG